MNTGIRSARPIGKLLTHIPRLPYSSTTSAAATHVAPSTEDILIPNPENRSDVASAPSNYTIASSVVLSRPPMLTADLTEFEESFYFYQRRLNKRLAMPYSRYFYFKKGTPADAEWKRKQKAALEKDPWTGFGPTGWKDELLVGDNSHKSPDNGYRNLVETTVTGEDALLEAETASKEGTATPELEAAKAGLETPLPRVTRADLENDRRSLDRAMMRTLYLLVKPKVKADRHAFPWFFPQSALIGDENLKQAAERTLAEAAGVHMNTWFVGNVPIGHHVKRENKVITQKTFFMKARIMAGQADLQANKFGLDDFMWLTKEEIRDVAGERYYDVVKHMLSSV